MPSRRSSVLTYPEPTVSLNLPDEAASVALAGRWALPASGDGRFLDGDLGAGKTTLVRAMLGRSVTGPVKARPIHWLKFTFSSIYWYHFDFYRFNVPEEFVDAGLGEYFRSDSVCLVEWPDKAAGFVPAADLVVAFDFAGATGRSSPSRLAAASTEGVRCKSATSSLRKPNSPRTLRFAGGHPRPPRNAARQRCPQPRRASWRCASGRRPTTRASRSKLGCREVLALHGKNPERLVVDLEGVGAQRRARRAVRQDRRGRSLHQAAAPDASSPASCVWSWN